MFKIGYPVCLWLFLLLPLLMLFFRRARKQKEEALSQFAAPRFWQHLIIGVNQKRLLLQNRALLVGLFFVTCALAAPQYGFQWETMQRKGIDIIIALDTSKSMLCEDIKPYRLQRVKDELKVMIDKIQGDRVGLVLFAGTSFVHCPLSLDYSACRLFLDEVSVDSIPKGGTDIGGAIKKAVDAFESKEKKHNALVLITDGEDHEQNIEEALKQAQEKGVKIFVIGIGSTEGAPIPFLNPDGSKSFVKDKSGNAVLSKLNKTVLQDIALKTKGAYISAVPTDFGLQKIYDQEISKIEEKSLESTKRKRYEHRYQWFLIIGIIFLVLDILLGCNTASKRKIQPSLSLLTLCVCLVFFINTGFISKAQSKMRAGNKLYRDEKYAEARTQFTDAQLDDPQSPELFYNIGNTLYRMKDYKKAEELYQKALSIGDSLKEGLVWYNLGNCAFRQGKLKESIDYYRKCLEKRPDDEDAKYNIEFVEKKIKEMLDQQKKRQEQQQNQQQQNQQDQQQQQAVGQQKGKQEQKDTQQGERKEALQDQTAQSAPEDKEQQQKQAEQAQSAQKEQEQQEKKEEQKKAQALQPDDQDKKKKDAEKQRALQKNDKESAAKDTDQAKQQTEQKDGTGMNKEEVDAMLDAMAQEEEQYRKERQKGRAQDTDYVAQDW